jgi:hypothetical protein
VRSLWAAMASSAKFGMMLALGRYWCPWDPAGAHGGVDQMCGGTK